MIETKCFTKEWLDECRKSVHRVDPGLLEKSIYAFDLLGRLAREGLPFTFKGGTALLLLLDEFRRLSIDVDIACSLPQQEVKLVVDKVVREGPYLGGVQDLRDPNRLPRRHHYALTFQSVVNPRAPARLLLDVLEDDGHYPETQEVLLQSRFIRPEQDVRITVPTVEGLLADKLTAFAPTTVGVPYTAYKATIKIAKHISDIGELFVHARNGPGLAMAYRQICEVESGYRDQAYTIEQTLEDTIQAACLHNGINLRGYVATEESRIHQEGTAQVDSHMIGPRHTLDAAKIAAARAAHLAACIRVGLLPEDLSTLHFYPGYVAALKDEVLPGRFSVLNRLKRFNPEAFHHWVQAARLLPD